MGLEDRFKDKTDVGRTIVVEEPGGEVAGGGAHVPREIGDC